MGYSSSYGIQFKGEFDSIPRNGSSDRYYFNISKKGADENISNVLCSANPVIHSYLNDEPKTYLKGSELEVTLINKDNSLPLSTFYSEEDDAWKIDFYVVLDIGFPPVKETLLFSGYLTIENCTEVLTDITHEIKLVFTDNLGELKNIKLDDALMQTPKRGYPIATTSPAYIQTKTDNDGIRYFQVQFDVFIAWNNDNKPNNGDIIHIRNAAYGNGYYTVRKVYQSGIALPITWDIYIEEEMPDISYSASQNPWFPYFPTGFQADIDIFKAYKKTDTVQLIDIYWIILYNTGIKLDFFVPNMLTETSGTTPVSASRMLEYIYIKLDTFFDNKTSDNIDEICRKLGYRFGTSLFQADGQWNLVRWNELRNTQEIVANPSTLNILQADWYGKNDFNWLNKVPITKKRNIGNGEDIEFGIEGSIYRPISTLTHIFNYNQPDLLIPNSDLQELGDLISTRIDGDYIYKRYAPFGWEKNYPPTTDRGTPDRLIEVVYDQYNVEQDRYIVITNGNLTNDQRYSYLQNYVSNNTPFSVNVGDVISLQWNVRADQNYSGLINSKVWVCLTTDPFDISKYWMMTTNGSWFSVASDPSNQYAHTSLTFQSGTYNEWQSQIVKSKPTPINGYVYLCFSPFAQNINETWFKDIEIKIKPVLDINNKLGHKHITSLSKEIKNYEEEEIYIDDTMRDYFKGTLFSYLFTGTIRDKTRIWFDGAGLTASLGEIITRQENLWRSKTRLKLEGNLFPVVINQGTTDVQCLSMLNVIKFLIDSSKYLVFGKLEIDYKMNQSKFTAYEMWREGEVYWVNTGTQIVEVGANIDKDIKYTFKYITE